MQPAGNHTPQAESFGDQRFSDPLRALAAVVAVCCGIVAICVLVTEVHHPLPAFIYLVLAACAFAQAWALVREPITALLREISEPFDIWDE